MVRSASYSLQCVVKGGGLDKGKGGVSMEGAGFDAFRESHAGD